MSQRHRLRRTRLLARRAGIVPSLSESPMWLESRRLDLAAIFALLDPLQAEAAFLITRASARTRLDSSPSESVAIGLPAGCPCRDCSTI